MHSQEGDTPHEDCHASIQPSPARLDSPPRLAWQPWALRMLTFSTACVNVKCCGGQTRSGSPGRLSIYLPLQAESASPGDWMQISAQGLHQKAMPSAAAQRSGDRLCPFGSQREPCLGCLYGRTRFGAHLSIQGPFSKFPSRKCPSTMGCNNFSCKQTSHIHSCYLSQASTL